MESYILWRTEFTVSVPKDRNYSNGWLFLLFKFTLHYGLLWQPVWSYHLPSTILTTLCVPVTTSFQPPLGEQCLVHTVHKSWEKSGCEARNLSTFTEWHVLWLASFPGLPRLQFLITCSVQERTEKGHHMVRNSRSSSSITAYCVWSQTGSTRNKATWGCVRRKYCGTVITQQC